MQRVVIARTRHIDLTDSTPTPTPPPIDTEAMSAQQMIDAIATLQQQIWGRCPELVVERVTDDRETYDALRCPTCGYLVDDTEDLSAVDVSERWNTALPDQEARELSISRGDDDYSETLYYLHDGGDGPHPVVPPTDWTERW